MSIGEWLTLIFVGIAAVVPLLRWWTDRPALHAWCEVRKAPPMVPPADQLIIHITNSGGGAIGVSHLVFEFDFPVDDQITVQFSNGPMTLSGKQRIEQRFYPTDWGMFRDTADPDKPSRPNRVYVMDNLDVAHLVKGSPTKLRELFYG